MAGDSKEKKRAIAIFMFLFLGTGGGIFLYMVVQGSKGLIGQGKEFSYGAAAREGVSSFFKSVGLSPEGEGLSEKTKELMIEKREEQIEAAVAANPDVSDWMAPPSKPSASPTSVPKMGGGGLSGAGGIGGGGSRSSGGVSRFGEGAGLGGTKISKGATGEAGTAEKGTLVALNRARSSLGEGLRSGSAATARAKWGSGFGEGSGKGGQMSYTSGGLVKLDTIKKGEVASLKASYMKKPDVPEAGAFERDKDAESKDAGIQAAKETAEKAAKEAAEQAAKKAAMNALSNAATSGTAGGPRQDTSGNNNSGNQRDNLADIPPAVQSSATSAIFSGTQFKDGTVAQDAAVTFSKEGDGFTATYTGMAKDSTGKEYPYTQTAIMKADGTILGWR